MNRSEVKLFGVGFDVPFGSAVALFDAKLTEFGARLQSIFGLRADQVRLRHSDILYGYELSASFFGGSATIVRDADHVNITLEGGRAGSDLQIILQTIEQFCKLLEMPPEISGSLTVHVHTAFASTEESQRFFKRFLPSDFTDTERLTIRTGGVVGFVKSEHWPDEIRLAIDPSLSFRDGAFIHARTGMTLEKALSTGVRPFIDAIVEAARIYDLDLNFLP